MCVWEHKFKQLLLKRYMKGNICLYRAQCTLGLGNLPCWLHLEHMNCPDGGRLASLPGSGQYQQPWSSAQATWSCQLWVRHSCQSC